MKRLVISALVLALAAGCVKDTDRYDVPVAKKVQMECVSVLQEVAETATEAVFGLTANVPWKVTVTDGDWLTGFTAAGDGDGNVLVTFPVNETYRERTARLRITTPQDETVSLDLTIVQKSLRFTAEPVELSFDPVDLWSPELTQAVDNLGFWGKYTHISSGYEVEFCCPNDRSVANYGYRGFSVISKALRFNTNKNIAGWIRLSCPSSNRIKSISIQCHASGAKIFTVYDNVSDAGVAGNALTDPLTLTSREGMTTFGWKGGVRLEDGQSVCLYSDTNNALLKKIIVEFE